MREASSIPVIVVAGAASGVGKTTITLGILEALRRRGLALQAFKVGPDFIDPAFHALATGRPSLNLDGWMCGREHVLASVVRHAAEADLAVVEGVMGCFDGCEGSRETGSTAEVAKWLGAPALLVVDAQAAARSAAAVVLGFERFDPDLALGGVIFNRVAGPVHRRALLEAVDGACRTPVLGAVPASAGLALPERHLGLVTAAEGGYTPALREGLAALVERHVDLDALVGLARSAIRRPPADRVPGPAEAERLRPPSPHARIAVARDHAFQFYYADNLEALERAGAELAFFSPLTDERLPAADGLYIGGGYPEVHAKALSANTAMRRAVAGFASSGRPTYAECGGLMYLAELLEDAGGVAWPMVGVLPAKVRMRPGPLTLGYREVVTTQPSPLGPAGATARGHEFHCSTLEAPPASVKRVYAVQDHAGSGARPEGFLVGAALMSYVHLHWGPSPSMAAAFVDACARARR
ncbi:MAG: cobyrinate a,c-diamide synthase [Candidatus Rokubacteria bacterium]|nr:cobyrinate a,c-diamide synthase [Candidatus Rokubacteria bacterium]